MTNYNEIETLTRQINTLERRISDMETSGRLFASGIGAGGVNIRDKGHVLVETGGEVNIYDGGNFDVYGTPTNPAQITVGTGGTVVSDGPVSFSQSSSFGGRVDITGNLTVTGNISFRNGIITSNALRNQMTTRRVNNTSTGWAISTGWQTKVSATISGSSVPSWATKAVVYLAGAVKYQANPTGTGLGWTNSRALINGQASQSLIVSSLGSTEGFYGSTLGFTDTINNPTTITGEIQVGNNEANRAMSYNSASISLFAIFYR